MNIGAPTTGRAHNPGRKWSIVYLSSVHRTAVEPMNVTERLFGKFMN